MSEQATVLLTTRDKSLIQALGRHRPDVRAITIEGGVPREEFPGPVAAFVNWLLPETSGLELCRRLREAANTRHARVTMVLEINDVETRRRALEAGADDYLLGPLTAQALLQRVSSITEAWPRPGVGPRLRYGDLTVDLASYQVRFGKQLIPLPPNEFRLLVHFVEHQDQVFSRSALIERLGKSRDRIDESSVNAWVGRLRKRLRRAGVPNSLRTVTKVGYVLDSLES